MKQTAYGKPILIQNEKVSLLNQIETMDEASIQDLVFDYPSCLPISEIDESFNPVIPVCKEMITPVGPLDIFMITPTGELVIIETKLWRNPEARRVVVAQILDYAKELSKWSYEDLQREVNRRLKTKGNTLYEIASKTETNLLLNESDFIDAVTRNLHKGKFLLLIVGDGIREGASGIAEFLATAGHLNFTFGMVELVIYESDKVGTILLPRVISKTTEIQKITVDIPHGLTISSSNESISDNLSQNELSPEREQERSFYSSFWTELISELSFDDPGQPLPNPAMSTNLFVYPGKSRSVWISAYFMKSQKRIGVYFRSKNDPEGIKIYNLLSEDQEQIRKELDEAVIWNWDIGDGAGVRLACEDVFDPTNRSMIKDYFKEWLNTFVNVIRPRMKKIEI
jgi:Domain of unknown function (DUF4268)